MESRRDVVRRQTRRRFAGALSVDALQPRKNFSRGYLPGVAQAPAPPRGAQEAAVDAEFSFELWKTLGVWYAEQAPLKRRHGAFPHNHRELERWPSFRAVAGRFLDPNETAPPLFCPRVRGTDHETLPQLIEVGDVDLIRALDDLGHWLPLDQLDEVNLSPAYYAVLHDQPRVLWYLDHVGVDLSKACDDAGYGAPAFYAAFAGSSSALAALAKLGVDLDAPCTKDGDAPAVFFDRHGALVSAQCHLARTLRHRSATSLTGTILAQPARLRFLAIRRGLVELQRRGRAKLRRRCAEETRCEAEALRADADAAARAAQAALDAIRNKAAAAARAAADAAAAAAAPAAAEAAPSEKPPEAAVLDISAVSAEAAADDARDATGGPSDAIVGGEAAT
ncbi:hypothetical protein M885DRAFT_509813 [Pelagophyceae sp. CCMP2097]|nr:hypothetical protein M885DRAFT_509813 [Pelagophyceae sp. CCMP2097]